MIFIYNWVSFRFLSPFFLPESNIISSHLKMDGWKMTFPFGALNGLFSGAFAVNFRECYGAPINGRK